MIQILLQTKIIVDKKYLGNILDRPLFNVNIYLSISALPQYLNILLV
jgi:hypothetical protein